MNESAARTQEPAQIALFVEPKRKKGTQALTIRQPAQKLSRQEGARLKALEAGIKKGLKSFMVVGAALLEVRDARLYRQKFATFEEYCQARWGIAKSHAYRMIEGAQTVANLSPIGDKKRPENEAQVRPISDLPPAAQRAVWGEVLERTEEQDQKITAALVQEVREAMFPPGQEIPEIYLHDEQAPVDFGGKPHVSHNSGDNEWYTPPQYIEAARRAMGGSIDTDPASCEIANRTVRAAQFFTAADNGLVQTWRGSVWCNPPYSSEWVGKFADALAGKFEAAEFEQACILVNNATETAWFQRLMSVASAICFIRSRVRFLDPEGNPSGAPLQGQCVVYLGAYPDSFKQQFAAFGPVWRP